MYIVEIQVRRKGPQSTVHQDEVERTDCAGELHILQGPVMDDE